MWTDSTRVVQGVKETKQLQMQRSKTYRGVCADAARCKRVCLGERFVDGACFGERKRVSRAKIWVVHVLIPIKFLMDQKVDCHHAFHFSMINIVIDVMDKRPLSSLCLSSTYIRLFD
ncbi:defensin [Striga asiatica]|uniref:Defensin n=1 Tax=Striga asiatica TaxID=4170 RepID=A0A5A7QQE9_STRAF|nr:defensin [Striga asiatica]